MVLFIRSTKKSISPRILPYYVLLLSIFLLILFGVVVLRFANKLGFLIFFIRRKTKSTDPITVLELQNPSDDIPELHKIHRSPDCKAPKL